MPRGPRLTLDNAVFHIINRGNAKQTIFHDEEDFNKFLEILARYKDKFGFKMYHFCLMPNHHHFEWEISQAESLSKAMQGIALSYSRYYHAKYDTVGYLWQGRFKNMIVEKEDYMARLGVYIELNAKRVGLVDNPEDWKWSSCRFYIKGEPIMISFKDENRERKTINLIDTDPFYEKLGDNAFEKQKEYKKFISLMDNQVKPGIFTFQDRGILGSDNFKDRISRTMKSLGMLVKPKKMGRPPKQKNN
ncbi:transposase [Patescibacteria group bacterium]|nr:transposase [Patescibacteria group bacterium]